MAMITFGPVRFVELPEGPTRGGTGDQKYVKACRALVPIMVPAGDTLAESPVSFAANINLNRDRITGKLALQPSFPGQATGRGGVQSIVTDAATKLQFKNHVKHALSTWNGLDDLRKRVVIEYKRPDAPKAGSADAALSIDVDVDDDVTTEAPAAPNAGGKLAPKPNAVTCQPAKNGR